MSSSRPRGPAARRTANIKPRLSDAERAAYEADSNAQFTLRRRRKIGTPRLRASSLAAPSDQILVVAEGDSWFDYKPAYFGGGKDLLGHLQTSGKINVYRVSKAGDTIENMVYGTTYGKGFTPKPSQIDHTLAKIQDLQPAAFLFSGGGNDLAGKELEGYLNHASTGRSPLRGDTLDFVFDTYIRESLLHLIDRVRQVKPGLPVFLHGYDYAIADGRDVNFFGFSFSGPWLRPALTRKRYLTATARADIIRELIDRLNTMLAGVASSLPDVHHVDLRGTLKNGTGYRRHWANELHPTSSGFRKIAAKFETALEDHVG